MSRRLLPQLPDHKLNTLCAYLGLELDHHRAGSDSLACGEILPLARSGAPAQEAAFLTQPMTYPQLMDRLAGVETCSVFRVL